MNPETTARVRKPHVYTVNASLAAPNAMGVSTMVLACLIKPLSLHQLP